MKDLEAFYRHLQELSSQYEHLCRLLEQKIEAAQSYNLLKLEDIMKEEQVYVLLSKGFDASMLAFKKDLGFAGNTLSQIIEELPPEQQQRFRDVRARLQAAATLAQTLNQQCQQYLEDQLYALRKMSEGSEGKHAFYGQKGAGAQPQASGIFSKSV